MKMVDVNAVFMREAKCARGTHWYFQHGSPIQAPSWLLSIEKTITICWKGVLPPSTGEPVTYHKLMDDQTSEGNASNASCWTMQQKYDRDYSEVFCHQTCMLMSCPSNPEILVNQKSLYWTTCHLDKALAALYSSNGSWDCSDPGYCSGIIQFSETEAPCWSSIGPITINSSKILCRRFPSYLFLSFWILLDLLS